MKDIIARLVRAREEKNISLQDISQKTNIRLENLARLESGDIEFQPPPYIRAMIRKYAETIGEKIELPPLEPVKPVVSALSESESSVSEKTSASQAETKRKRQFAYASAAALALVAITFAAWWMTKSSESASAPKPQPAQTTSAQKNALPPVNAPAPEPKTSAPAPAETQRKPIAETSQASAASERKHTLVVRSKTDTCWISVASDKNAAKEMLLAPAASATFDADSLFTLTVGKLETAELWLNGKPVTLPRRSGMISGFKLTPPKD